jgi:hypothetical protein
VILAAESAAASSAKAVMLIAPKEIAIKKVNAVFLKKFIISKKPLM